MIESAPQTPPALGSGPTRRGSAPGDARFRARFAFTGSLRRQAARGTLVNAAFTIASACWGW